MGWVGRRSALCHLRRVPSLGRLRSTLLQKLCPLDAAIYADIYPEIMLPILYIIFIGCIQSKGRALRRVFRGMGAETGAVGGKGD